MKSPTFLLSVIALLLAGCGRPAPLAEGPFDLGPEPLRIAFADSSRAAAHRWLIRLEFDLPGGSDHAAKVRGALLTAEGIRDSFAVAAIRRRGERLIDLEVRLPNSPNGSYSSVELTSDIPLRIRSLRGGAMSSLGEADTP